MVIFIKGGLFDIIVNCIKTKTMSKMLPKNENVGLTMR